MYELKVVHFHGHILLKHVTEWQMLQLCKQQ